MARPEAQFAGPPADVRPDADVAQLTIVIPSMQSSIAASQAPSENLLLASDEKASGSPGLLPKMESRSSMMPARSSTTGLLAKKQKEEESSVEGDRIPVRRLAASSSLLLSFDLPSF